MPLEGPKTLPFSLGLVLLGAAGEEINCSCFAVSGSRTLVPPINGHLQFLNRSPDQLIELTLTFFSLLHDPGRNEFMRQ